METKANYATVGFFTILVVLAAFGFVYWMSAFGQGATELMIVRIPGSANGLSIGSPVRFNGIPIGTVRALNFDREHPAFSVAIAAIRADTPVYPTTKAVLEIQGLTGAAYIELSGGNPKDDTIFEISHRAGKPAELIAEQSGVTNLVATASEIMKKADTTLTDIQGFVVDNRKPLTNTIANAEAFSKALKDNSAGVDKFLASVSDLSGTITKISGKLDSTLTSVDALVKSVDPKKIDSIIANADKVSGDLASASGDVKTALKTIQDTVVTYQKFGDKANKTLDNVDKLMASIDPAKIGQSVDDIHAAVSDARTAIASIKGVASDIDARRADINTTISNITDMSKKLNAASTRVDGVLAKVDSLLGSGDANSLMSEARATLESFKKVADTLNAKIGPIADNLAHFSGPGLRDVQALVQDTRRTMQNLDNAISRFDNDPQRLLFGGDEVKQYNGRVRR
jgi:phospholipid/cholesterol/gamma-HCH transport system substrate-binding protein